MLSSNGRTGGLDDGMTSSATGGTGRSDGWDAGRALAAALRSSAVVIVDGAARRLSEELPDAVAPGDGEAVTAETLALLLDAVAERRRPTTEEVDAVAGASAAMAARQGLPVDTVLQRHRLVSNEVWRAVAEAAAADGELPQAILLEVASLVWDGTDLLMVAAARAHRLADLELERQHEEERRSFLRALLLGSITPADLQRRAAQFGLPLDTPIVPFRARTLGGMPLHRLEAAILEGTTAAAPGLTALLEGTLLGVLPSTPTLPDLAAVVGVGPPVPLGEAKASFQHATRALETAAAFELHGVYRVEDLPLRALVASEPYIGDSLVARYLEPLDGMGQFGPAVEQTLRSFFERGMRVEETARALDVHPNTLRHRLRRFEEVTATDLSRTEELFRIWWALERRRLLRGLQGAPVTTA